MGFSLADIGSCCLFIALPRRPSLLDPDGHARPALTAISARLAGSMAIEALVPIEKANWRTSEDRKAQSRRRRRRPYGGGDPGQRRSRPRSRPRQDET